ncbi:MAG TPA: permease [Methylomirabilota bacterium]|nr:permease [Methylomirabilota bacterium]
MAPAGFAWFAQHEARLAFRDMIAFLTGGRRRPVTVAIAWIVLAQAVLHGIAFAALLHADVLAGPLPMPVLILVTGLGFLSATLMLAQAMESVTRVLYGRADLDLILSSPASVGGLFALRTGLTALGATGMALFLVAPFINAAATLHGAGWLAGYGVVAAMGMAAAAVAISLTLGLFRLIGPKRTRTVAQIVAAVIGAGFVIGGQAAGILLYGDISRIAVFSSPAALALAPDPANPLWWPARAASGDIPALMAVLSISLVAFVAAASLAGVRFSSVAVSAASAAASASSNRRSPAVFSARGARAHLRAKELRLLIRDPWLISQTLMQILYLLPPGLMLWLNFGRQFDAPAVLAPIMVMAAGQLAGGLAWLTISGEDAPDLIATAPIASRIAMRAKIEAVLVAVAIPIAPLVAMLAVVDVATAGIAVLAILAATASSATIQFLFRTAARRSQFRRRQTASRIATFAEAFSSISWAAAAGLAAAGTALAAAPVVVALLVLAIAYGASTSRRI